MILFFVILCESFAQIRGRREDCRTEVRENLRTDVQSS